MPWFPVDDAFHSHPKARKAGDEALGMWCRAGSHCMAYLTDGFVAEWWVKEQPKGLAKAKRLVNANLWRIGVNADGEPGWWFHDWKPENLKVNVLAARQAARLRKAKSRESHRDSRVTDSVTDAVSPTDCLVPTQPNPAQPINPLVNSGGGGAQVAAPHPRPHCSDHPNENAETGCRPCKRRRLWDEEHADEIAAAAKADELDVQRRRKEARENCTRCHGTNTYEDEHGEARICRPHVTADARHA